MVASDRTSDAKSLLGSCDSGAVPARRQLSPPRAGAPAGSTGRTGRGGAGSGAGAAAAADASSGLEVGPQLSVRSEHAPVHDPDRFLFVHGHFVLSLRGHSRRALDFNLEPVRVVSRCRAAICSPASERAGSVPEGGNRPPNMIVGWRSALTDLVSLVEKLRRECPWDREQTPETIRTYLLEECYETLEAMDSGRPGGAAGRAGGPAFSGLLPGDPRAASAAGSTSKTWRAPSRAR